MPIRTPAITAETGLDWPAAHRLWLDLYQNDSHDRTALLGTVRALCQMGRFEEAEDVFREAPAEHGKHFDYAISFAETAQLRASLGEAVERNLLVLRQFPDKIYGYATSAVLLIAAGSVDEAAEILRMAHSYFGDALELLLPDAHLAIVRQEWPTAAAIITRIRSKQPDQTTLPPGLSVLEAAVRKVLDSGLLHRAQDAERNGEFAVALEAWRRQAQALGGSRETALAITRCHRGLGDVAAAELVLAQAKTDYPLDPEIAAYFAYNAEAANNWPAAATRWREVLSTYPEHTAFAAPASIAFARAGAIDEAEALLARMIGRDPACLDLRVSHAIISQFGGNWPAAVSRWKVVIDRSPDNATFRNLHGEAIWHLSLDRDHDRSEPEPICGEHSNGDAPHVAMGRENIEDIATIMTDFESIGDNCEFGLVQRHFGAEPVCLFRFSALQPGDLIKLLDLDLEPLGDPAHTVIFEEGNEYIVKDDRGYYWMHSFLRIGQVEPERYLKQQRARIILLKRKFLTDLRTGSKIYVCKQSDQIISDETLRAVSRSLLTFADNMLLGIRLADAEHPSGSVEHIDRNILVGYVRTMFGHGPDTTDHKAWEKVIRAAHDLRIQMEFPSKITPLYLEVA